ncbi:hypothetical protein G7Y79_00064g093970, partial [Physcia stellaris]
MATLETIPAELKRSILNNISDVQTLQNLVHASPDYHAVYLSAQPEIFTSVTLQELSCRGIDISKTEPMIEFMYDAKTLEAFRPLARYSFQTWEPIASALRQIRRHERGLDQRKPAGANLVLSVDQCLVLLYLGAIVWIPAEVRFHEPLSYPEKAWIEITQKSPLNVEVPLMQGPRAEGYEMHTIYLDDIREGYEKLAIKPLYYWP